MDIRFVDLYVIDAHFKLGKRRRVKKKKCESHRLPDVGRNVYHSRDESKTYRPSESKFPAEYRATVRKRAPNRQTETARATCRLALSTRAVSVSGTGSPAGNPATRVVRFEKYPVEALARVTRSLERLATSTRRTPDGRVRIRNLNFTSSTTRRVNVGLSREKSVRRQNRRRRPSNPLALQPY